MSDTRLYEIQALQFTDQAAAEALLLAFIRETFPHLAAWSVKLRTSAVSLNSFNGTLTLSDGRRLFFKTHVEPDSIVNEYYNSQLLADAGYPIIRPRYASTEYGKQFLIYDLISLSSVFDVVRSSGVDRWFAALYYAQPRADAELLEIYLKTLAWQSAEDAAKAPVHQLFYHRLAGKRYQDFYIENGQSKLPLDKTWIINRNRYTSTLRDLIANQSVIAPGQAGPSVIGHGDAHNGNVFLQVTDPPQSSSLIYFDPAFAGRHHPLLDLAKPLFHNVFASWMYEPQDHWQTKGLFTFSETADTISITFARRLRLQSRLFFGKTYLVLEPLLIELKKRDQLPANWRLYLKTALFCCAFLTVNLTDESRYPERVKWLGLAYCVLMGSESEGKKVKSQLDFMLDSIEARL